MNRRQAGRGASFVTHVQRKPWRARVYLDGKEVSLGYFGSLEAAQAAHAAAIKARLGDDYLRNGAVVRGDGAVASRAGNSPAGHDPCP
jgi:hypothetical protein